MMRRLMHNLRQRPASIMEAGGCAVLALGAGLVYLPAGIIVAGVLLVLLAQGVEE